MNENIRTQYTHVFNELLNDLNPERTLDEFKQAGNVYITSYMLKIIDKFIGEKLYELNELLVVNENMRLNEPPASDMKSEIVKAKEIKTLFEKEYEPNSGMEIHTISKAEVEKFNKLTYSEKLDYWDNVVIKKGYAVEQIYYPPLDLKTDTNNKALDYEPTPIICIKPNLKNNSELTQYLDWCFQKYRCESPKELDFSYLVKIHFLIPKESLKMYTSLRDDSIDEESQLTLLKKGYDDGRYSIKYLHELNVSSFSLPQLWFAEGYFSVVYKRPIRICETCFEETSFLPFRHILKGRIVAKMINLLEFIKEDKTSESNFINRLLGYEIEHNLKITIAIALKLKISDDTANLINELIKNIDREREVIEDTRFNETAKMHPDYSAKRYLLILRDYEQWYNENQKAISDIKAYESLYSISQGIKQHIEYYVNYPTKQESNLANSNENDTLPESVQEKDIHPKHDPNLWNKDCFKLFMFLADNYKGAKIRKWTNIWFYLKEYDPMKYTLKCTKDNYKVFIKKEYRIVIKNFTKADHKYSEKDCPTMNDLRINFEDKLKELSKHVKNT